MDESEERTRAQPSHPHLLISANCRFSGAQVNTETMRSSTRHRRRRCCITSVFLPARSTRGRRRRRCQPRPGRWPPRPRVRQVWATGARRSLIVDLITAAYTARRWIALTLNRGIIKYLRARFDCSPLPPASWDNKGSATFLGFIQCYRV